MADAQIQVTLPDGSIREMPSGTTVSEVASSIGKGLAKVALGGICDGKILDLRQPITSDIELRILTKKDPEAGEIVRHTAEHVLADAVKRLWPGTQIDAGRQDHSEKYQYDFRFPRAFTPEDLEKIEAKMAEIIKENHQLERIEVDRQQAAELFGELGEELKLDRLADIPEGDTITVFRHGPFLDLCRGPHLRSLKQIGAIKLIDCSGVYYRGDETNEMLQRIYGTAFSSKGELIAWEQHLAEIAKRDHRRLGTRLGLFSFHKESPGSPFFKAAGAIVYNQLVALMRERYEHYGYDEVITPQIFDVDLWHRSGHYENYREGMFFADGYDDVEERSSSVKPMNCPSHCLMFSERKPSYRELPVRMADFGRLHRYERTGALAGLTRVRSFCQDDAHIFCTPEQIGTEISSLFDFIFEIYELFGFSSIVINLSTRPEKAIGDPAVWEHAEAVLQSCLDERGVDWVLNAGDGAFYGPKIDFEVSDAIGRKWQLATIQLDFNMPERFELAYIAPDGSDQQPVMIHRAILGSIERFFGVMLEHFAGDLPPWLAPQQARILPITDDQLEYAEQVETALRAAGVRVKIDRRSEKLGWKVRDAETSKVPYLLVIGGREAEASQVSLRLRHRRDEGVHDLSVVVERIAQAVRTRSLEL